MAEAEGEAFVCGTCFIVFESKELLKIHSSMCAEEKPHVCVVCGEVFSEERQIIEHNAQHHRAGFEETIDPDVAVKTEAVEETQSIQGDMVDESTDRRIDIQNSEMVSSTERPKVLVIEPIPEPEYKTEVESGPQEDFKPDVGSLLETEPAEDRHMTADIVTEVQTHLEQFENKNRLTNGPASKFQVDVTPSTKVESTETQGKKVIVVTVSKVDEEAPEPAKQKTVQSQKQKRKARKVRHDQTWESGYFQYKIPRPTTPRDWSSVSEVPSGESLRKCTQCDAWFLTRDKYHKHMMSQHSSVYFCKLCDKVFPSVSIFERHVTWHKRKKQEEQISKLLPEMTPKFVRTQMIKMVHPGAPKTVPVVQTPTTNNKVLANTHTIQSPLVSRGVRETFQVVRTPMVKSEVSETTRTAQPTVGKTGGVSEKPPLVQYTVKFGNNQRGESAAKVQDTTRLGPEAPVAQNTKESIERVSELQTNGIKTFMTQNTSRQSKKVNQLQNTVVPGETFQVVQTPMVKSEVPETTRAATTIKAGGGYEKQPTVEYTVKLGGIPVTNSASKAQDTAGLDQQASVYPNRVISGVKVSELQITGVNASLLQNATRLVQKAHALQTTMNTSEKGYGIQNPKRLDQNAYLVQGEVASEVKNTTLSGGKMDICSSIYEKTGQCGICEGIFCSKQLNTQILKANTIQCDHCGRTFTEVRDYNRHVATHSKDPGFITKHSLRPYTCAYCDKPSRSPYNLFKHLFTHVKEQRYQCDICDSTFTAPFKLEKHKEYTHTNLRYQCHLCDKMVKTKTSMATHLRRQNKSEAFAFTAVKLHAEVFPDDSSRPYKCDWCDKSYDKKWGLSVHIRRSHTGEKPYRCPYCKELFSDSDALRAHTATHTGGRSQRCDLCGKSFITIGDLNKHLTTHVQTPLLTCLRCPEFFDYEAIQVGHVAVVHRSVRPYVCFYCMEEFEETVDLVVHMLTNHKATSKDLKTGNNEEPYRCDACGKTFTSVEGLARDILTHVYLKEFRKKSSDTARLPFSYSVASTTKHQEMPDALIKEESESESLSTAAESDTTEIYDYCDDDKMDEDISHASVKMETNSGGETENEDEKISDNSIEHQSKQLPLPTENDEKLDVSIKEETEDTNHLVQCRQCKMSFAEIEDLLQHVKEHSKFGQNFLFPLQCRLCKAYFSVTESLKLHLQTHREKPETFECAVCGKSFTNRSVMARHMRVHNHVKPCECTVCGKTFVRKSMMDSHMLTHTGEKPLQCDHTEDHSFACKACENKSARKQYLNTYIQMRNGRGREKLEFSCDDCKKEFASKRSLALHQSRHANPFQCDGCCHTFKDKAKLIVHKWKYHQ